jgi:tetratricopeptide (TPR) repeat protein
MRFFKKYKTIILSSVLTVVGLSCSTEKDAALNRGYHNMTARFNGYYNAGVLIETSLEAYRGTFPDEYHKILPLEIYPTEKDAPNLYPEMDKGIEKCERVILRHSMPMQAKKKKDEELCRWIDDNWLVIAQAHFYKREYMMAEQKFDYIQKTYVGEESVYEAQIWLAKTQIALGNFAEAKRILSLVESSMETGKAHRELNFIQKYQQKRADSRNRDRRERSGMKEPAIFPKRLEVDYEATMADFHIQQGQYKEAIEHLEIAVKSCKNKKKRARYMFVLAQLYQQTGDGTMATYYYTKVARSSAPYEMRFQAKINRALSATSGGSEIRKELYKMLRDEKNAEFKDQIYFALGEMDMREGQDSAAMKNYSSSVYWSVKNNRQKGLSYLRLADMHFVEQDYVKAQKYYDSCVKVLPEDYDEYVVIKNKADGLADLVYHYETVVFEDSVQMIAAMDPAAREKFLKQTLKEMEEAEALRKKQEQERMLQTQTKVNDQSTTAGTGSKWYFYNSKVRGSGFNDFRAQWGSRPLEDNWRRSEKSSFATNEDGSDSTENVSAAKGDTMTVDDLMTDIPLTQGAMDSSNVRLMNSLYMLGVIYKEQLKEEEDAITYFKQVIDRGIEHPRVLASMYQLYLIYTKRGSAEAETYKQMILSRYPDSEIADIMRDPEYLRKKQEEEKKELNEYAKTLIDYQQRYYGAVITKCNEVINFDTTNQYINKYYLLKAFAISKTDPGNKSAIASPLQQLYDRDPQSEEGKQAKIYLDKINAGQPIVAPDGTADPSIYKIDNAAQHFFVIVVPADGNPDAQKIKLSNFNSEFFRTKRYSIINTVLNDDTQLLIVKTFANADESNQYIAAFKSATSKITIGTMASDFQSFVINSSNYAILTQKKETATYVDFYSKNYPQ